MKTATFFGALSLAGLALAQPSGHRRHAHLHEKRQIVTVVDYVTSPKPDIIVYVNDDGTPLYTSTVSQAGAATSSVAAANSTPATVTHVVTTSSSSAAASSTSSAAKSSSTASSDGTNISGYSIAYSPYAGTYQDDDVTCKTAAQVLSDFELIDGYEMVRIYGTDCNQVANVLAAASAKGMKVFAGVYDITEVESELAIIVAAAAGDWSSFHTISIGNELVNDGTATVAEVTAALTTARSVLGAAGYTGNIVTVDTFIAILDNPELCEASDYTAANAHPFFDGGVTAQQAGTWVTEQIAKLKTTCGSSKDLWITETGWPSQGDTYEDAVPSTTNQADAVAAIKSDVSGNVIFLTAFNDYWKNPGDLDVEQYWGLIASSSS